ncbi:MAG: bifunctional phosphoribosylaminoimidazolecarboxamide formyltransferase/IMP cyclohydrolase [Chlorobi bacterium]|nr:bifunctional phosphoribosylaminoimidazolecarboxamide formyltransferase/IMP cyclohydrolase [Chlorobiota bacterium]
MKKYALLSVSDKTGIVDFGKALSKLGYTILATGNTARTLNDGGVECVLIENYASFPEIFDGRVKTLQPQIFGGILMRPDNEKDKSEAKANGINPIQIVCVNLYPFPKVVNNPNAGLEEKIENIDIGGPSLIRAAAKNYKYVSVLTSPEQYDKYISEIENGEISLAKNEELASAAFSHTSYYDTIIANFFEEEFNQPKTSLRINYKIEKELRYGENPHQKAFIYGHFHDNFDVLHGKELSYNNIVDLTAAIDLLDDLDKTACVILKHTNPAGAAVAGNAYDAYVNALSCDPVSSFGGIVAFNDTVDEKTAEKMNETFLEIICAPRFTKEALQILKKKKQRRLLTIKSVSPNTGLTVKSIPGGLMIQEKDNSKFEQLELKTVTKKDFPVEILKDLKIAWAACKHTKSNAIVFAKDGKTIGVGAGQMSRVDSAKLAAERAKMHGHNLNGAVAASDAFFPFPDGLEEIASHGIDAVIQPGGSVRDAEVIEAANKLNISMIFTGIRNFKH